MNNQPLTNAIAEHIFANLGVFGTVMTSITQDTFLTSKTIAYEPSFEDQLDAEKGNELIAKVFACQTSTGAKKLSLIYSPLKTSCKKHIQSFEHFLLVKLEGSPAYGCYLLDCDLDEEKADGFIATELTPKNWIPTTTYIQATFLAGMEQLKDLFSQYKAIEAADLEELLISLKEFIAFQGIIAAAENEMVEEMIIEDVSQ